MSGRHNEIPDPTLEPVPHHIAVLMNTMAQMGTRFHWVYSTGQGWGGAEKWESAGHDEDAIPEEFADSAVFFEEEDVVVEGEGDGWQEHDIVHDHNGPAVARGIPVRSQPKEQSKS